MKSASYYTRKASICRELGRWAAADEWAEMAARARRIEQKRKQDKAKREEALHRAITP